MEFFKDVENVWHVGCRIVIFFVKICIAIWIVNKAFNN